MNTRYRMIFCAFVLIIILSTISLGVHAEDSSGCNPDDSIHFIDDNYEGSSFSGYIPDDEERLTNDLRKYNIITDSTTMNVPVALTEEQKKQIKAMMEVAKYYTTDDSVGNPIAPPYDELYTREIGEISDQIVDYGDLLLCDLGNVSQFNVVNSDYARLLSLLQNPIINARFAAYTCYLSYKEENNYNNWYEEKDWQQFILYREALFGVLTDINEDYLRIDSIYLTYEQKRTITNAFFNLLELYDDMTLDNALLGDVDGDGEVSICDVTVIQRNLVGMNTFTQGQKLRASTRANASHNGPDYDITSATVLQRYLVGINTNELSLFESYNFPAKEIRPTHEHYPDLALMVRSEYKGISIWNSIICITQYSDERLEEIESFM